MSEILEERLKESVFLITGSHLQVTVSCDQDHRGTASACMTHGRILVDYRDTILESSFLADLRVGYTLAAYRIELCNPVRIKTIFLTIFLGKTYHEGKITACRMA